MTTKRCPQCRADVDVEMFGADASRKDGLSAYCSPCGRAREKERYARNGAERARRYRASHPRRATASMQAWRDKNPYYHQNKRLRQYGETRSFPEVLAAQGGGCAICGNACPTGRQLSIDHDHATERFRGLLCADCNLGVGKLRDDPDLLYVAAAYLAPRLALVTA